MNHDLEFNTILEQAKNHALSQGAGARLLALTPLMEERRCRAAIAETTEARLVLESCGSPPLSAMTDLPMLLELASKGAMLVPEQLSSVGQFLLSCRRTRAYLKKAQLLEVGIASYGGSISELTELCESLERSIRHDRVDDNASGELASLRRQLAGAAVSIKDKLDSILRSNKAWFADSYVTVRNGRYVLPVKREYKSKVNGSVVESSNSGGTCFIEPASVRRLQEELSQLQFAEENEVRRILYTLTASVDDHARELGINLECMETLDFAFAKAKLSVAMNAIPVPITTQRRIVIRQGRHPLIPRERCVPLDFQMDEEKRGVVITGPNTGGKTVVLKTVGLLTLMAQCGLHVPAAPGTTLAMRSAVLWDIGDGQSITENLSTFSAHLTGIISILGSATAESLVLLDELGSGTDPAEGMGLAIAVLEELRRRGCLLVATTHYPEIKEYARTTPGMVNARMEFDRESLQPLYRLVMGQAGESCALHIARRLGFPEHMLARAQIEAYGGESQNLPAPPTLPVQAAVLVPDTRPAATAAVPTAPRLAMGDSVTLLPDGEQGIVYRPADGMGLVTVQVKGEKRKINHKRIRLLTPASELYPPDYDFSIVFDSVDNRKARRQMDKGHNRADLIITYDD